MIRKRIFTILTAVFMVLAFSAMSFAANQVTMKTTVPNIPRSTCYQAGTDTMEFDDTTTIGEGDVIQYTLNNGVTFCKPLNMWLRIADVAGAMDPAGADSPVSAAVGAVVSVIDVTHEWGFLIQAAQGSQIATLTLRVRDTATNTLDPLPSARQMVFTGFAVTDKLIVKLFDGKIAGVIAAFFKPLAATPTVYDTAIVVADNAICIDTLTQNNSLEYVQNTPDSIPIIVGTKLNFSGDYVIAHIMPAQTFSLVPCAKSTVGHIALGAQSAQSGTDSCASFEFETAGIAPNGYCADHLAGNKLIVATSSAFDVSSYTVSMQIVVERAGVAKAIPGVYWSDELPTAGGYSSLALACTGAGQTAGLVSTYKLADGMTVAGPRAAAPAGVNSCDLLTAQKAVYLTTAVSNLNIDPVESYLWLDIPQFNYDPAEILSGDVVKVLVTLTKSGCGSIGPFTLNVGTFGCGAAAVSGSCLFPYFTSLAADANWWNGIAIVNTSAVAGTATITAYEQDGSVGTATVDVAARSMYVNLLENIAWTGTDLGGSPAYISVSSTSFDPIGFGMIANPATGESMGYLAD